MGHPHPQRNRALLYWLLASGEGGDTLGLLRVGEGGRQEFTRHAGNADVVKPSH